MQNAYDGISLNIITAVYGKGSPMNNISLKSIKYESIKAIFTSIADSEKISRAAISEKTDLSLVTVGKIADALLDLNIICQVKEIKPQAGRRAGLLSVNINKFALILDITSYDFRIAIINLRLCLVEHTRYTYRPNISYADNLHVFFAEALAFINRNFDIDDCFGVGVAVPGPYNSETDTATANRIPELSSVKIRDIVSKYFTDVPLLIDSQINAAAKSNISHVDGYTGKNILYWYVSPGYVCGAYTANGSLILGKDSHACDFGRMIAKRGTTLEDLLSQCNDEESCAEALSGSIYNVIRVLNPHLLIMEYDVPFGCDNIFDKIRHLLSVKYAMDEAEIPEMQCACCRFRNSHRGLTMGLRELWLDKIVFGTNMD